MLASLEPRTLTNRRSRLAGELDGELRLGRSLDVGEARSAEQLGEYEPFLSDPEHGQLGDHGLGRRIAP